MPRYLTTVMRWRCAVAVLLGSIFFAPMAEAALINTYSFTQDGYVNTLDPSLTGTLTGTFTGLVEDDGYIKSGDLYSLNLIFDRGDKTYSGGWHPFDFSYLVGGGNSSLNILAAISEDRSDNSAPLLLICVGQTAPALCASTLSVPGIFGIFARNISHAMAQVTLVSSENIIFPPPPPIAPVPVPNSLLLFGSALGLAACLRLRLAGPRPSQARTHAIT